MAKGTRQYVTEGSTIRDSLSEKPARPLSMMLLGKTGSGKSTLGNALLGKSGRDAVFKSKVGMVSCKDYQPVVAEGKMKHWSVRIVDTPGVLDNVSPEKALDGICQAISCTPEGVTAFVIVLRADVRFTQEESDAVTYLQQLFGEKFWQYAICVYTHGDAYEGDKAAFEAALTQAKKEIPNLNRLVSSVGSRVLLVDSKHLGIKEFTEFVSMVGSVRKLNGDVSYTNALFTEAYSRFENIGGAELIASLNRLKEERQAINLQQLQVSKEDLEKKIKELEERIRIKEDEVQKMKRELDDAVKKLAKRICVIL